MVVSRNKDERELAKRTDLAKNTELAQTQLEKSEDAWLGAQQVQCLLCHHDEHGELKTVVAQNLPPPHKVQEVGLRDRLVSKAANLESR